MQLVSPISIKGILNPIILRTRICVLLVFSAWLAYPAFTLAGNINEHAAERPRIALVLSGGGARGAAHVGVLKVLEELRVPVDMIVGTSMGAIVGGAYATGMSVADLESQVARIRAEHILRDDPPREDQSERRKQDDTINFIGPEFGIDGGELHLPIGAVSGIRLEALLRDLIRQGSNPSFDALPIPFRAIATDIVTGQMLVIDSGNLVSALRASMSIPGLFAPAEVDGRTLIDGGLTRNLAVDVAQQLDADIVIAVNLGTPLMKRDEVTSLLGVSTQMINILTEENVRASLAQLKDDDILISPQLDDFASKDFDHMTSIVPAGVLAAYEQKAALQRLSLSEEAYELHRGRQKLKLTDTKIVIDEIRFKGLYRTNPDVLKNYLKTRTGLPLEKSVIDRDLGRLYGLGDFVQVGYRTIKENDKNILLIELREKAFGPDYLRFGLGLSNDFAGNAHFQALASHRKTWINYPGAEWRNDLRFGRINQLTSEFYQPLTVSQTFFIAPYLDFEQKPFEVYEDSSRVARFIRQTSSLTIDGGININNIGELRVGVYTGSRKFTLDTGPVTLQNNEQSIEIAGTHLKLRMDHLNSSQFPRDGYRYLLDVVNSQPGIGAQDRYTRWESDLLLAHSIGDHTFHFAIQAGGNFGDELLPNYDLFQLGGFLQLSGLQTGQLLGQSYTFSRLLYANRITRLPLLQGFFGGFSVESGRVNDPLLADGLSDTLLAGSMFLATDTPLGPVYLALGVASGGNTAIYFYLGVP